MQRFITFERLFVCFMVVGAIVFGGRALLADPVIYGGNEIYPDHAGLSGGGPVTGDIDFQDAYSVLNTDTIRQEAQTSDAAADALVCEAGNAYYLATVNIDGAPLVACGGISTKSMAVVQATSDTSTITITTVTKDGVYTSTTLTLVSGAPGAGEIQCITSDAVCAGAIVTYLASAGLSVTAEAVAAQVYLIPSATMCAMGLASANGGGTKFVLTNGDDGQVLFPPGILASPEISFSADPDTGITQSGTADQIWFTAGADGKARFVGDALQMLGTAAGSIDIAGGFFTDSTTGTEVRFIADQQTQFCNALENQCFTLGASAADTMTLWDKAGTGAATLELGGGFAQFGSTALQIYTLGADRLAIEVGQGGYITQQSDNPNVGEALLTLVAGTNKEMTAASGTQYGIDLQSRVLQTVTAAYVANQTSVTDSSSGSGQDYLERQDWGADGVHQFKRQDDGDMLLHEDPGSDTAPLDGKIFGANAYAQASAGVNRNGADLNESAGIRTLQIVCSDRTLTDTDVITFWIDGVAHTLTESTDFDCFGEASEDACCLEIAAALVTADIGLTPDAVTTAGTIYVTPDEDLLSVDIEYTDGGVNDVGWTLTEGETGEINFYGSVNVYDDAGDGAYWREFHTPANKTQPAAAGPTATFLNTATFVYLLDANTEYLYFGMDVHDDWDGSSDLVVEVQVALSGGETANDILNAEIVVEYVGDHEDIDTGIRTQTRTINHDIVSDNGQGDVHHLVFIIDEDLGSHEVAVDDNVSFRFRLDVAGGAGQVAAVWYMGANVKYRTSKPQLETGGSFPTEG